MKQSIIIFLALVTNCFAMDPYTTPISMSNKTKLCTAVINITDSKIDGDFNLTQSDRNIWCYKYLKQNKAIMFDQEILGRIKTKFKIVDLSDFVGTWQVNNGSRISTEIVGENGETYLITEDENMPMIHLGKYVEVGESIMLIPSRSGEDVIFFRPLSNYEEQFILYNHQEKMRFVFEKKLN
jgi:hypothetical protein